MKSTLERHAGGSGVEIKSFGLRFNGKGAGRERAFFFGNLSYVKAQAK
jgi:hypothetical protein